MSATEEVDLRDLRIEHTPRRGGGKLILIVLVLLVPVAFVVGWWLRGGGGGGAGGSAAVRVDVVRTGSGSATRPGDFTEGGWVEVPSYHPIIVSSLIPGRVDALLVLEGGQVGVNTVVAKLYEGDLLDEKARAEAAVGEARAALDLLVAGYRIEEVRKAEAEVRRLDEERKLAARILTRTEGLVPTGAASAENLERDRAATDIAAAALARAEQELARLKAGFRKEEVAKARATLARAQADLRLAEKRVSYAEIRSPVKGIVLERFVTAGTWLSAGNPRVVSVYDPDDMQTRVDVRQENASRVRIGQKVKIRTEAETDRSYGGTVVRIDPLADFKKNTVQAKIRIDEPGPALHPEMICRVTFLAEDASDEPAERGPPTVSAAALVRDDGRTYVYLMEDDRVRRTEVRLGEERGGRFVVESGLKAGDRVVLDPPDGLADGDDVEVK